MSDGWLVDEYCHCPAPDWAFHCSGTYYIHVCLNCRRRWAPTFDFMEAE